MGLRYTVLEARVCFGILNGTKGQKRKSTIRGIEMSHNTYIYIYIYIYIERERERQRQRERERGRWK